MTFINHYEILEIEANADLSAIKSAFNKLAMRFHPDRNLGDPIAEAMMKKLNQALRILSDTALRKDHDEYLFKNKPNTPPNCWNRLLGQHVFLDWQSLYSMMQNSSNSLKLLLFRHDLLKFGAEPQTPALLLLKMPSGFILH